MKTAALQRAPDSHRPARRERPPERPGVLAQRSSTFGGAGSAAAPALQSSGRPLDDGVRASMESGFGHDFSNIRVHDDARAHDAARDMGAQAYAAGNDIVFGQGAYSPDTPSGQALIAHELAHNVQQAGVQMKADGPLPAGTDAALEAQADRAAGDITAGRQVSGLSKVNTPAIYRATTTPAAGPSQKLPPGMTVIEDTPVGIGTTRLRVLVDQFTLPLEKGPGKWVQEAYDVAGVGERLVFSPLFNGEKVGAYKEGKEDYAAIWLGMYGFAKTKEVADAFLEAAKTKPEVAKAVARADVAEVLTGFTHPTAGFREAKCDVDHIVEKQIGGTSIPRNLQLLVKGKNQESGLKTFLKLVDLVNAIRDPAMRGPKVKKIQLQLKTATVPKGTDDPSYVIEDLLRRKQVSGSDALRAKTEGTPVNLTAGGVGEDVNIKATGKTLIGDMARRIVPGMRLLSYTRGPGGVKSKKDNVEAELDSKAMSKTGETSAAIKLTAEPATASAAAPAAAAPAPAAPAAAATAVSEARVLKLSGANKNVSFYYPYLSPGKLTSMTMDAQGNIEGKGTIKPSVPFLGELEVIYAKDKLELVAPIPHDKLKSPIPAFRFTEGSIGLQLSPNFVPDAKLKFAVGPEKKPVLLGALTAKYEGGAFIASGALTPGGKVPGLDKAKGDFEYSSLTGWSGKVAAQSTAIPNSTIDAEVGFKAGKGGGFQPYATGGLTSKIKDKDLFLKVGWDGQAVSYTGGVTIPKPMPMVDEVKLEGGYVNEVLTLKGDAAIKWKSLSSTMHVKYTRKEGEDGKFSGKADVKVKTEKADGLLNLNFGEDGSYWGGGSIAYQVTKDIKPKLGVELTKAGKIKLLGEVALADIALSRKWPGPAGGKLTFIKGAGLKFNIPTPVPGVTAYGEIKVSAGLGYGVGPVMLKGVKFNGELFPMEDDPQVKAKLTGALSVPAYGEIYGTFGAYIGAEILLGAAGAKGGVEVTPTLRVDGEGGINFAAGYENGAFNFEAEAFARGQMTAKLKVDLVAEIYAVWGVFSHQWTYNVASLSKQIGPELKLTLGKVAYGKDGVTWPSPSQIKLEPANLDPLDLVKDLMGKGKATKTGAEKSADSA